MSFIRSVILTAFLLSVSSPLFAQTEAREKELEQAKEIKKAYKELEVTHEDLKAAQTQLTAGIAHEIKNPLNFVNNFSDLSVELIEEARDEVKRQKGRSEKGAG